MCVPPSSSARDHDATRAATTKLSGNMITKSETKSRKEIPTQKLSRRENRKRQIDALNVRVEKLTKVAIANAETSGKPLEAEYIYAQQPMTALWAGTPVYQMRSAFMVYLFTIGTGILIAYGVSQISYFATALSVTIIFFGYDVYSGVLHVVFDHPDNISLPIFGQACLEFQWHHAIPDDLVRRDFVDVCGDLNAVAFILAIINCYLLDISNPSPVAMVIGGMKLWMAYLGQFSHRSAHTAATSRSPVVNWLQHFGFLNSPKEHLLHHKPPHDNGFCLIGVCNPIIEAMRAVTTNIFLWMVLFLVWSIFDVVIYVKLVEWIVDTIGA